MLQLGAAMKSCNKLCQRLFQRSERFCSWTLSVLLLQPFAFVFVGVSPFFDWLIIVGIGIVLLLTVSEAIAINRQLNKVIQEQDTNGALKKP